MGVDLNTLMDEVTLVNERQIAELFADGIEGSQGMKPADENGQYALQENTVTEKLEVYLKDKYPDIERSIDVIAKPEFNLGLGA